MAIIKKQFNLAKELLSHGVNPNSPIKDQKHPLYDFSPICLAAFDPNAIGLIPILLKAGADLNHKINNPKSPFNGFTPSLAMMKGNKQAVTTLLVAGAPVDDALRFTQFASNVPAETQKVIMDNVTRFQKK